MGNYNCQECVDKEVNIINELLLDNKFFGNDSIDEDNQKIKNLRASKEDLKKAIENTNLSKEQKNYVQKMLNDNELLESQGLDQIKFRISKNSSSNENNYNENIISHEQQKIIENQKEQILEQQKVIEEYKKQQLL